MGFADVSVTAVGDEDVGHDFDFLAADDFGDLELIDRKISGR